jgi:predicted transcriptional regulator
MEASAAEQFVLDMLKARGPLTTMEIEVAARKENKRCPDQTVLFLTKMRKKGLINGEASLKRRGWVWWIP